MGQDHYLVTETELDRIRELLGAVHGAVLEYIESRKLEIPPWEEGPEAESCRAIMAEVEQNTQPSFDF